MLTVEPFPGMQLIHGAGTCSNLCCTTTSPHACAVAIMRGTVTSAAHFLIQSSSDDVFSSPIQALGSDGNGHRGQIPHPGPAAVGVLHGALLQIAALQLPASTQHMQIIKIRLFADILKVFHRSSTTASGASWLPSWEATLRQVVPPFDL